MWNGKGNRKYDNSNESCYFPTHGDLIIKITNDDYCCSTVNCIAF